VLSVPYLRYGIHCLATAQRPRRRKHVLLRRALTMAACSLLVTDASSRDLGSLGPQRGSLVEYHAVGLDGDDTQASRKNTLLMQLRRG
jgi:hypothetical protein